jgi:hypothetical protein
MAKSIFSKKIFCGNCGSGMRRKNERGKIKYLCSRYSNNSNQCSRKALIEESFILDLILKRYGEMSTEQIRDIVDQITVRDKLEFEIKFNNDDESILFSDNNFIRY